MPLVVDGIEIPINAVGNAREYIDKVNAGLAKTDNSSRALVPGLESARQSLQGFVGQNAALLAVGTAVVVTLKKSYDAYQAYAGQVRDLSLITNASAEESSRFLQVLDDYELTYEDATAAAKKLKDQGLTPNIETLITLSKQYQSITDPAEKFQFVQDNLGKGGAKWNNILSQTEDQLRATAAETNKMLILTNEQVKKAELQRLAVDKAADSWEGFKVSLGAAVGELVLANERAARANEILEEQGIQASQVIYHQKEYQAALAQATEEQNKQIESTNKSTEAAYKSEEALKAEQKALEDLAKADSDVIDQASDIAGANRDYTASQDEILAKIEEVRAKQSEYYPWEKEKIQESDKELEKLGEQYFENRDKFIKASQDKITMMAIEKIAMQDCVAGYSQAEYEKAKAILESTDIASAAAFEQQQAQAILTDAVATGQIKVEDYGKILDQVMQDGVISVDEVTAALQKIPPETVANVIVNTTYTGDNLPTDSTMSGSQVHNHAFGGSWVVPSGYGHEGYPMGGGHRASPGETITVTPANQQATQQPAFDQRGLEQSIIRGFETAILKMPRS